MCCITFCAINYDFLVQKYIMRAIATIAAIPKTTETIIT